MQSIKSYYYLTNCSICGFDNRFTVTITGQSFMELIASYLKEMKNHTCNYCEKETEQKLVNFGLPVL